MTRRVSRDGSLVVRRWLAGVNDPFGEKLAIDGVMAVDGVRCGHEKSDRQYDASMNNRFVTVTAVDGAMVIGGYEYPVGR